MAELRDEHFEVISENKAKAHEQQKDMRDELAFFVMNCSQFNMQELYSEMKRNYSFQTFISGFNFSIVSYIFFPNQKGIVSN